MNIINMSFWNSAQKHHTCTCLLSYCSLLLCVCSLSPVFLSDFSTRNAHLFVSLRVFAAHIQNIPGECRPCRSTSRQRALSKPLQSLQVLAFSFEKDLNEPLYILLCCFCPQGWKSHREFTNTCLPYCLDNTQLLSSLILSVSLSLWGFNFPSLTFFPTFFYVLFCSSVTPFMPVSSFSSPLSPLLFLYCCFSDHITHWLCWGSQYGFVNERTMCHVWFHAGFCPLSELYRLDLSFSQTDVGADIIRMSPFKHIAAGSIASVMAMFASVCSPFSPQTLMWQMTTEAWDCFVQKLCQIPHLGRFASTAFIQDGMAGKIHCWAVRRRLLPREASSPFFGDRTPFSSCINSTSSLS